MFRPRNRSSLLLALMVAAALLLAAPPPKSSSASPGPTDAHSGVADSAAPDVQVGGYPLGPFPASQSSFDHFWMHLR